MKVKFIDGPAAVDIVDLAHNVNVHAKRGEYVEVPDEVGKNLLRQDWQEEGKRSQNPEGDVPVTPAIVAEEK